MLLKSGCHRVSIKRMHQTLSGLLHRRKEIPNWDNTVRPHIHLSTKSNTTSDTTHTFQHLSPSAINITHTRLYIFIASYIAIAIYTRRPQSDGRRSQMMIKLFTREFSCCAESKRQSFRGRDNGDRGPQVQLEFRVAPGQPSDCLGLLGYRAKPAGTMYAPHKTSH